MFKHRWTLITAVLAVAAIIVGGLLWLKPQAPAPQPVKLRFASTLFFGEMLSFVAYDKGFFREQGLEIELSHNKAGWQSLKQLFEGQVDVATVAQLPVVYSAIDRSKYTKVPAGDFAVVADLTIANRLQAGVGRRDRGINGPADLRGKTIGLPRGSTADFFVDSMLRRHGLSEAEVTLVNLDVDKQLQAITNGDVDAVLGWQPHTNHALKALGDNGVLLEVGYRYPNGWLLVFMKDYLRAHPDVAERYLRAIAKAEDYVNANPLASQQILAKHLKMDLATVQESIDDVGFKLSMSETLLSTMDEQARWAVRRGLAKDAPLPNFRDYFDEGPLRKVKPQAITVIQ